MLVIRSLKELPGHFGEFVDEMLPEYRILYGGCAAAEYERIVEVQLGASLAHSSVSAFGAFVDRRVAGIAVCRIKGHIGQIVFVHVLRDFNDEKTAPGLIAHVVHVLRERSVTGIIMDCIPLCTLRVDEVLKKEGFRCIDRMLMCADLNLHAVDDVSRDTTLLAGSDWEGSASLFLNAFRDKPEKMLYDDLGSRDNILQTLRLYREGNYGRVEPQWARSIRDGEMLQGVVLGTAVSDDTGFIFQVAVEPCCQGRGIAKRLVGDLLSAFRLSGMEGVMLGVTADDAAYHLYRGMGFEDKRLVQVYVWGEQ